MISIWEFEKDLQREIHKDFMVKKNVKAIGLATVFFKNEPLFGIGADGLSDHKIEGYGWTSPTGTFMKHRTYAEAFSMAQKVYQDMKSNQDNFEAMMGLGKYSSNALK